MALYNGPAVTGGQRGGVAFLTINGEAVDVASDLTYDATERTREDVIGQSGVQGFSESFKTGRITAKIRDARYLSQAAFMELTNASVVGQLANGKTVSGDGMWCTECSPVATSDGTFDVTFSGRRVTET
ncbi:MAG TPA: phage tail tube protein [Roseomonas sp.]|nr:phage tail tube protein [Roseomonas sp.]